MDDVGDDGGNMRRIVILVCVCSMAAACGDDDGPATSSDAAADARDMAIATPPTPPVAPPPSDGGPAIDAAPPSDSSVPPPPPSDAGPVDMRMSFFVTSIGTGSSGGNYGGLAGADAFCLERAAAAGVGDRTWRAYLSTSRIDGLGERVDARDRIGPGPWFDARGDMVAANLDELHGSGIAPASMLTELGTAVPGDEHDIVTGSQADGTAFDSFPDNPAAPGPTCLNWTSNADDAYVWVGHSDWIPGETRTWNAAHETTCSEAGLRSTAGAGRIYCFAL